MPTSRPAAYQRLAELIIGSRVAIALRVIVERGIPDLLAAGPKSTDALAAATGLPVTPLRRLMRALTEVGVFTEVADGEFANTDVAGYMRKDATPSLREMILVLNDDAVLDGWRTLGSVVESGEPAFPKVNGTSFFQWLAADQTRSQNMGKFMGGIYGPEGGKIAAGFPFDRFKNLLDVGGGQGHILAEILKKHPGMRGGVFDLPKTADQARAFLAGAGLTDRTTVVAGDFFESVPAGYDAYMAKSVLHDWDDQKSIQILRHCRRAMGDNGRMLICEIVVQPGKSLGHPHRFIDLEMMVTLGGRERTAREFSALLSEAGFKTEGVTLIPDSFFGIVEGKPV